MEAEKKQKEEELEKKKKDMDDLFDKKIKEREAKILKRSAEVCNLLFMLSRSSIQIVNRETELRTQINSRIAELEKLKNEVSSTMAILYVLIDNRSEKWKCEQ